MDDSEKVMTCPFNKAHSILKGRMQFHLTRCRVQYQDMYDLVPCPYNATHLILRPELEFHQQTCKNRIVLDSFVYQLGNSNCPVRDTVPINQLELPACEENWDDDAVEQSVLDVVKEKAKDKGVLLNLIGAPKAERKAHRVNERLRYQRVVEGLPTLENVAKSPEKREPKKGTEYKDVRLPRGRGTSVQQPQAQLTNKSSPANVNRELSNNLTKEMKAWNLNSKPPSSKLVIGDVKCGSSSSESSPNSAQSPSTTTMSFAAATGSQSGDVFTPGPPLTKQDSCWTAPPNPGPSFAAATAWGGNNKMAANPPSPSIAPDSNDFPRLPIAGSGRGRGRFNN